MGISSSNKIGDILRLYTMSIAQSKSSPDKEKSTDIKAKEDYVSISEEGKKKMRERFQSDVINYLRTKY